MFTHLYLVPKLRMSAATVCSPYMASWSSQGKLYVIGLNLTFQVPVVSICTTSCNIYKLCISHIQCIYMLRMILVTNPIASKTGFKSLYFK